MNSLPEKTLAQIVTGNFRTAAVFEKYHLDYCCKGKRSLHQACSELDIPVEQLVQELENLPHNNIETTIKQIRFDEMTLSQLADYIVSVHHHYVNTELQQIPLYLEKIAAKHGARHPELLRVFQLMQVLKEELILHMQKEELVLFPRIKQIEQLSNEVRKEGTISLSYLQSPIISMEQEHDHAGDIMSEICQLTHNYTAPDDACTTYKLAFAALQAFETDLHHHVHLENNILFPKALILFKQLQANNLN